MLNAQVEGFVAVAREGNLRRAAELLYVSQPALTARIQGLEAELGTPLFRRTRSGMELTHAGRAFLPYAQRALESLRGGAALVAELSEGVIGELAIGAAPAVSAYVLPELLARTPSGIPTCVSWSAPRTPRRSWTWSSGARSSWPSCARCATHGSPTARCSRTSWCWSPVPTTRSRLRARSTSRPSTAHSSILFDRTSSYYDLTNALFRGAGVVPRGVMELDNIEAAKRMVERGLGVALLPGTAVAQSLAAGSLTEVTLVGAEPIERRMVMVEHQGSRAQPETAAYFVSLLRRIPELIPRARPVRVE